jgi:hypothetical protein
MPSINFNLADVKPFAQALGLGQAPNVAAPPVDALPTPPMPLPPVPAVAGFGAWVSDPATQNKIASGITLRGTPLIPPPSSPPAPLPSGGPNYAYLSPPAGGGSAAPPDPYSYLSPPTSAGGSSVAAPVPGPGAAGPSGVASAPGASAQTPKLYSPPAASAPALLPGYTPTQTTPAPVTPMSPAYAKLATDQGELQRQQTTGSGVSQIKNPWLRTVARIGDVVGSIVAPGVTMAIPGTTYHHDLTMAQQGQRIQDDRQSIQDLTGAQQAAATLAHTNAETGDIASKSQQQLAVHGLKSVTDENGKTSVVPDTDSPVYKANQDKDAKLQQQTQLIGAQIDDTKAQKELRDAQAAFNNAKADPNSPLFKQTQQRLVTAQQNANAASVRAKAYMGNYMQHAYNVGLDGNALPGAPIISDDNGNQSVVGSTNAGTAIKNQSNAAQFNDVHGALDNLEQAATSLVQSGGSLNSPGVAAALAQPKGTLNKWLQGAGVKANLSPEERAYVQSVASAHENIQALRKSAGGTSTDSAVDKLDALIPNASTPDLDYLKGQTGQIRATAERLGKGATVATGGLTVRGQQKGSVYAPPASSGGKITVQPPPPSSGMITVQIPGMPPGQIHASQQANFLRDNPGAKVVSSGR